MPKNLVILSDGTCQDGGAGRDTNVYKLFRMLENRTFGQIVFYDPGLGTDWRRLTGSAAGAGFSNNVLECYHFVFDHFEAGDKLLFFGFSRGAATVASLAHFIHRFGILPRSRPGLIRRAWRIYRNRDWDAAEDFAAAHHTMWTTVRFLGLWDSVAALGVPWPWLDVAIDRLPLFRHRFHRFDLSEVVEHGRHALAIDDDRTSFHPELWPPRRPRAGGSVKQVWFAGSHSDVGGGFPESHLSDVTLEWMLAEAIRYGGLRLQPGHGVALEPSPYGRRHDPRARGLARLYRHKVRSWPEGWGPPTVHRSVLDRAALSRDLGDGPLYAPWILRRFADHYRVEPWSAGSEQAAA